MPDTFWIFVYDVDGSHHGATMMVARRKESILESSDYKAFHQLGFLVKSRLADIFIGKRCGFTYCDDMFEEYGDFKNFIQALKMRESPRMTT